jgi:peptidoglycan hydrolase CwlO-like protein
VSTILPVPPPGLPEPLGVPVGGWPRRLVSQLQVFCGRVALQIANARTDVLALEASDTSMTSTLANIQTTLSDLQESLDELSDRVDGLALSIDTVNATITEKFTQIDLWQTNMEARVAALEAAP